MKYQRRINVARRSFKVSYEIKIIQLGLVRFPQTTLQKVLEMNPVKKFTPKEDLLFAKIAEALQRTVLQEHLS